MRSSLEIFDLDRGASRVVWQTDDLIEAPNWDPVDDTLLFNGGGRLFRIPAAGGVPQVVDTGFADACNNDHGISPDGSRIAISHQTEGGSCIFTLPSDGGVPVRITENTPSYWHGWSPDGARLAYCAERGGQFDIYTIGVGGGAECQLTGQNGPEGHNDGPDYSADGRFIWFNSDRTGHAQIWRMDARGGNPVQITDDARVNWFPHPSPDGAKVLYLSYPEGTVGHPADKPVELRLMQPDGSEIRTLAAFQGGQGTINVPCWAADGRAFAFVKYA
ncbi:MAG: hypothetical protein GKR99_01265 [Rhodobacteraceae bacterium]|nr:hypothetical protein [Paracoccaceae bacterium]